MNSTQYTIRSIPNKLDVALRGLAQKSGRSLNEVVIDTLAKGAGIGAHEEFHDLDWFIGGSTLDNSFDEAMKWLDSLPMDME